MHISMRTALRFLPSVKHSHGIIRRLSSEANLIVTNVNDKSGIAVVSLQRPPVNSLNLELLSELSSTLTQLEKNKCRGMILTSTAKSVFSSGLDIFEMYKPDADRVKRFWSTLQETWIKLYGTSYPTVAVINGHAPAGGCLLSLSCEYRIMSKGFTIGLNETLLGIVAPFWFRDSMRNVIGHRQTELSLTTGRMFKTEEALSVGLVDEAVESKEEGLIRAEAFFAKFAKIPPMARTVTKQYLRQDTIKALVEDKENDLNYFLQFVTNPKVQQSLELYLDALKKKEKASS